MNGIHDMGGLHGFGTVVVEPNEPVFHEPWEARVFGVAHALPNRNIDAGRHSIERLDPVAYLRNGYYGRWLAAMERAFDALGVVTAAELAERIAHPKPASRGKPESPYQPPTDSFIREVSRKPRFAQGDRVRTQNHQPSGHTRLPAYARCKSGVIEAIHPAMVYPDDHAHHRGENPQHLYTVKFAATELWGSDAEPSVAIHLDLFEPYLDAE